MNRRAGAVLVLGLAFVAAVLARVPYVNGPWYWQWAWRSISLLRGAVFLGLPLLLLCAVVRRLDAEPHVWRIWRALAVIASAMFLMTLLGILTDPEPGLLLRLVRSTSATSYYTDALKIERVLPWLSNFHRSELVSHSTTNPPGPILFYYLWISLFGPEVGGLVGACMIAVLAALGVPVLYRFGALWTDDPQTRLLACVLYSLLPGLMLFFPAFDAIAPICSMLLFLFWARSLDGSASATILFGAALFLSTLLSYKVLPVGALLLIYTVFWVLRRPREVSRLARVAASSAGGLAMFVVLHGVLWITTGYQPIHSFLRALSAQQVELVGIERPYAASLLFDPYDFALGAGILPVLLLGLYLRRAHKTADEDRGGTVLALVGVLGILAVDLSGLVPGETSRVWLFLQPWVVLPAAMELRKWAPGPRNAVLFLQWGIVVVLKCTMIFVAE